MAAAMCSSRKLSTPPAFAHAFYTRSAASTQFASLGHISRPWELTTSNSVPALRCLRLQTGGRRGVEVRAGKGFGELLQRKRKGGAEEKPKESLGCPCGGGDERREYSDCCARYHGGVVEPDALNLMKARFSGYARSKVGYVVRTTHRENPDFGDEKTLAADVRATCERLRFTRLEILEFEETSEDEAFVSFRVTYSVAKGGRAGDKQYLVEKSRFVKEDGRWLYRDRIPISQASEAAWLASHNPNYV